MGSFGTQLQLEMLDHFGNFDLKKCQMPYITAKKLCRNDPIHALSLIVMQFLVPDTTQTSDHTIYLFMLTSQVTHPGPTTCHFQLLDVAVMAAPMILAAILLKQLF